MPNLDTSAFDLLSLFRCRLNLCRNWIRNRQTSQTISLLRGWRYIRKCDLLRGWLKGVRRSLYWDFTLLSRTRRDGGSRGEQVVIVLNATQFWNLLDGSKWIERFLAKQWVLPLGKGQDCFIDRTWGASYLMWIEGRSDFLLFGDDLLETFVQVLGRDRGTTSSLVQFHGFL